MSARPLPWRTNGPADGGAGSFAHRTLKERVPRILDETLARLPSSLPPEALAACRALRDELTHGTLRGLHEEASDVAEWARACAPHVGHSWLDLPWYFAESFFYRRILEATGYFQPGPGAGVDPFRPAKLDEEAGVPARVNEFLASHAGAPSIDALVRAALWGNRADLSYTAGRAFGDAGSDDDLIINDISSSIEMMGRAASVAVLLDNAGTELAFDLLLAAALVSTGKRVVLYAKAHPFFVSDAMPVDVARTATLLGLPALPTRAPPFMTSSGFLIAEDMPADLIAELGGFDVALVKGDANARRLVGDVPFDPGDTRLIAEATDFPCPFVSLRTLKSEVLVGAESTRCANAQRRDPLWLVNGRRGVVQFCSR